MAKQYLEEGCYHLAMLDIMLPELDRYKLLEMHK